MFEMYFLTMAVIKVVHQIASAVSLQSGLVMRQQHLNFRSDLH